MGRSSASCGSGIGISTAASRTDGGPPICIRSSWRPSFRRLGIAEALTRAASSEAEARGADVLTIGVDGPNAYARRLYEKWGFKAYHASTDLRGELVFLRRQSYGAESGAGP